MLLEFFYINYISYIKGEKFLKNFRSVFDICIRNTFGKFLVYFIYNIIGAKF